MPFQSEKQRRYLWANEPEIARDWTDTYGSGIAKALGGRIGFFRGAQADTASGQSMSPGTSASGGSRGGGGGWSPGVGGTQHVPTPSNTSVGGDRIIDVAQRKKRQDVRDLLARQQAEKDYGRFGKIKPGPQLGWAGSGAGPNIGNWASGFAGSKIGGGLGSMLFGPLGMLLGSLFGQGVGRRAYKASQTDEKETAKDILLGQNTLLSNLFNKKPTGEGIETIDIRDKFNRKDPGRTGIDLSNMDYDKLKTIDPRMGMYGPRALGLNPNDLLQDRRKRGTRLDVPIRSGILDQSPWAGVRETEMKGRNLDDAYGLYGYTPEFREFNQWEGTQAQQEDPYVRGFDLVSIPSEEDLMYGDI